MQRLLIRHISGTRANQVDDFQAEDAREILIGRDENAAVRFDPDRDDLVSRLHAKIYPGPAGQGSFFITDLQSRNGVFLNRQRIGAPMRIQHGDAVQLGPGGPEFRLEFDPPPHSPARPTRALTPAESAAQGGLPLRPTRAGSLPDLSAPRPIGRATVERMLDVTFGRVKKESGKTLWVGVAAMLLIVLVGGGAFLYMRRAAGENAKRAEEQQVLLLQMAQVVKQQPSDDAQVRAQMEKLSGDMKKIIAENQSLRQSFAAASRGDGPSQEADASGGDYNAGLANATQFYKTNEFEKAYAECVRISGMDPDRWEGYYIAGLSAEAMNQAADAQTAYQIALAHAPDSAKAKIAERLSAAQATPGQ